MTALPRRAPLVLAVLLLLPGLARAANPAPANTPANTPNRPDKAKTLAPVVVTGVPLAQTAEDIIAPVAVLSGAELDARKSNTLGETVASIPGVTTSYFGPGVGRPIIRGLDGSRVAVLANGLSTDDVSNVSQDHAVTIEPFLADQVEVLKGPSTLLFGSGAIGGVVNVVDGRIHERAGLDGVSGRSEFRYDTGYHGFTDMSRVDIGGESYNLHADGVYRSNDDYHLSYGRLPNSAVDTRTGALAGSVFGDWGFAGVSASRYLNDYGNPAEPGDGIDPAVTLKMQQNRYEFKGGLFNPVRGIDSIKLSFGRTDYEHSEFEGDRIGTQFISTGDQLRLEATHAKVGAWQGAFGVQANRKAFEAIGEEAFVPATRTRSLGAFAMEQGDWNRLKLELGLRVDRQSSTPDDDVRRSFDLTSVSTGASWRFDDHWHVSLNLDRAQRAPAEEELFANGPHAATATFEIGDPGLGKETSKQAEIGVHYHGSRLEASLSAYRNRFDGFIFLADTGLIDADDGLPVRTWVQADATFRGFEGEATYHLIDDATGKYDVRVFGDRVRATRDDGSNLPRIPAARLGAEFRWSGNAWRAGLGVVRTGLQDDVDAFETTTQGYTMINADLAYTFHDSERSTWEAFAQGSNLSNQDARLATSVVKDRVPLPGRNLALGVRVSF
jgi:iron complex outermembrane recepter protein